MKTEKFYTRTIILVVISIVLVALTTSCSKEENTPVPIDVIEEVNPFIEGIIGNWEPYQTLPVSYSDLIAMGGGVNTLIDDTITNSNGGTTYIEPNNLLSGGLVTFGIDTVTNLSFAGITAGNIEYSIEGSSIFTYYSSIGLKIAHIGNNKLLLEWGNSPRKTTFFNKSN